MYQYPTLIKNYNGTLEDFANELTSLPENQQNTFYHQLAKKLYKDAINDFKNKKIKLSQNLLLASYYLNFEPRNSPTKFNQSNQTV